MTSDKPTRRPDETPAPADEEGGLFRRAMADARPLERSVVEPVKKRLEPRARFTRRDERAVLDESLAAPLDATEGGSGDSLSFCRPTVGRRTLRKLARGKFSIQDELDLHGMTVAEARESLKAFIAAALARRLTCVRVIHGKGLGSGHGGPILKRKVDVWLRQWDAVVAFVSAKPVDGGTGALYVLLKRP